MKNEKQKCEKKFPERLRLSYLFFLNTIREGMHMKDRKKTKNLKFLKKTP